MQFPGFPSGSLQKNYECSCFFPTPSKMHSTVLELAKFWTKSLIFKTKEKKHSKLSLHFRFLSKPGVTTQHIAYSNQELAWYSPYTHHDITPQAEPFISTRLLYVQNQQSFIAGPQSKIHASNIQHCKCQPLSQRKLCFTLNTQKEEAWSVFLNFSQYW